MVAKKEKQFIIFILDDGKTVKYDLSTGKTYGKTGKEVKSITSQLRGYNVVDLIESFADENYSRFLSFLNAKVVNKSFRDMVNEKIAEREVFEAILINRNGIVTEGSKSNIFMIKDDALYTSKVEAVLPGVTRTEIIELAEELNIQVNEVDYNYLGLKDVDAMFISGTSPKILPIKKIEEEIIDVDNKVLRKLMRAFNEKINDYILNFN